ncbi:MAG: hypothetical protein LBI20_01010 [Holosporales bacterium]|jgi:hypothetical protein|nr:hypothetical protein [Holosporales bacterium]
MNKYVLNSFGLSLMLLSYTKDLGASAPSVDDPPPGRVHRSDPSGVNQQRMGRYHLRIRQQNKHGGTLVWTAPIIQEELAILQAQPNFPPTAEEVGSSRYQELVRMVAHISFFLERSRLRLGQLLEFIPAGQRGEGSLYARGWHALLGVDRALVDASSVAQKYVQTASENDFARVSEEWVEESWGRLRTLSQQLADSLDQAWAYLPAIREILEIPITSFQEECSEKEITPGSYPLTSPLREHLTNFLSAEVEHMKGHAEILGELAKDITEGRPMHEEEAFIRAQTVYLGRGLSSIKATLTLGEELENIVRQKGTWAGATKSFAGEFRNVVETYIGKAAQELERLYLQTKQGMDPAQDESWEGQIGRIQERVRAIEQKIIPRIQNRIAFLPPLTPPRTQSMLHALSLREREWSSSKATIDDVLSPIPNLIAKLGKLASMAVTDEWEQLVARGSIQEVVRQVVEPLRKASSIQTQVVKILADGGCVPAPKDREKYESWLWLARDYKLMSEVIETSKQWVWALALAEAGVVHRQALDYDKFRAVFGQIREQAERLQAFLIRAKDGYPEA